jgi:hypothetical protein
VVEEVDVIVVGCNLNLGGWDMTPPKRWLLCPWLSCDLFGRRRLLFWLLLPPDPLPPLPRLLFDEFIAMLVLMEDVLSDHEWSQSQVGVTFRIE